MAAFSISCKSLSPPPPPPPYPYTHQSSSSSSSSSSPKSLLRFSGELDRRRRRGLSVVTRAGGPSSSQLIFAFVFPLSLIAITVFSAFQVGNQLDQKFLDELAMNEAIREEEEYDKDEDDVGEVGEVTIPRKEEAALPRTRNRPKREV